MFFFYIDIYVILNMKKCQYKKLVWKIVQAHKGMIFQKIIERKT